MPRGDPAPWDLSPEGILAKYGIIPSSSGAVNFSPPSGTYPGRSYQTLSQAYSSGAQEYANALARQAQQQATPTTVTPTIAPATPTPTATTATPTTTPTAWPTSSPSASITTPQINYTPANNAEYIQSMSDLINQINQDAQRSANAGRIPGAAGLEAQSSKNIGSALQGIIPEDVQYQIAQQAAERGVGRGSPLGASTTADMMRALGLTSLQLQGTGQEWLNSAYGRNPAAPIFDPTKLLITPSQATEFGLRQGEFDLNKLQLDLQTQLQRDQQQLQRDLANASNQLERDRLIWQYQQNQLNRENALKIAQMEAQSRQRNYAPSYGQNWSGGYPATSQSGGFNLNWPNMTQPSGSMTQSSTNVPSTIFGGTTPSLSYDVGANPSNTWDFGQVPSLSYDVGQSPSNTWDFGQVPSLGYDVGGGGTMDWGDLTPDELIALYTGGY